MKIKNNIPDQLNVGDWVFTKDGKLREITSHDMDDLKYEDVDRMATNEETPWFNFNLGKDIGLHKENFWDPFIKRCPYSVGVFCKWIDAFKISIKWKTSIGENVKFHDLPFEMQYGVLCQFLTDTMGDSGIPIMCDWLERDENIMFIISRFVDMELEFRNDGIKDHW